MKANLTSQATVGHVLLRSPDVFDVYRIDSFFVVNSSGMTRGQSIPCFGYEGVYLVILEPVLKFGVL